MSNLVCREDLMILYHFKVWIVSEIFLSIWFHGVSACFSQTPITFDCHEVIIHKSNTLFSQITDTKTQT